MVNAWIHCAQELLVETAYAVEALGDLGVTCGSIEYYESCWWRQADAHEQRRVAAKVC